MKSKTSNAVYVRCLLALVGVFGVCGCDQTRTTAELITETVSVVDWASRIDTLAGAYTTVVSPAEFWDSILIVPDAAERLLWKVNITTGEREQFGSRGGGPGEYARVSWAMKVHADSVAIVSPIAVSPTAVISVATGTGRTAQFSRSAESATQAIRITARAIIGSADTLGYLYASTRRSSADEAVRRWPEGFADGTVPTVPRLRLSVRTGIVDTAGYVPINVIAPEPSQSGRPGTVVGSAGPYSPYNSWLTLADGRAVLAGGDSYLLEVLTAEGESQGAWTLDYPPITASESGYQAWVDSSRRQSSALVTRTLTSVGASQRPPQREISYAPKPVRLPALNFGGVRQLHGSGDVVWIPVHVQDPPQREVWDLVNIVERKRICRVALDSRQSLLLVTDNAAYVTALDDLDLERIVRFQSSTARCL